MRLAAFAAPLVLAPAASADVLYVTWDGTGEYVEIADAVAAASDGDLVYVRGGTYVMPVVIDGLAIDLIVEDGTNVNVTTPLEVRNTSAHQAVAISGLTLQRGFVVEDCAGVVQIQRCATPPSTADLPPPTMDYTQYSVCGIGSSRQRVTRSRRVSMTSCILRGGHGRVLGWDGTPADHGLIVEDSTVLLHETRLEGGDGGVPPNLFAGYVHAGAGGDGLRALGSSSVLYEDLTAIGGEGFDDDSIYVTDGCDGIPVRADGASTVTESTSPSLRLFLTPTVVGGQSAPLQLFGAPGATVVLVSSPTAGWRPFGPFMGTLVTGAPFQIDVLGQIDSGGILVHTLTPPDPGTSDDFLPLQIQALALHQGQRYLSKPWRITVVDSTL